VSDFHPNRCPEKLSKNTDLQRSANSKIKVRRHPDSNWGIEVLQTSALPLGYAAEKAIPLETGGRGLSYDVFWAIVKQKKGCE
jgi:hypothetical protein